MRWIAKLLAALWVILASIQASVGPAHAAPGDVCDGGINGNDIFAGCSTPGRPPPGPNTPSPPAGPRPSGCVWVSVTLAQYVGDLPQTGERDVEWFVHTDGSFGRIQADGNRQVLRQLTDCGARTDEFRWVDIYDVQDAIDDAVSRARQQVPTPMFDVSPESRGIVNFGMWLAVPNADTFSVRAGIGAIWAVATATFTASDWDMGDGGSVSCDGPGEAIDPDSSDYESPEQGPCGYTYTQRSPSGEVFTISVTGTWTVTWVASDGRSGGGGPGDTVARIGTRDYDVNEIQTVGAGD